MHQRTMVHLVCEEGLVVYSNKISTTDIKSYQANTSLTIYNCTALCELRYHRDATFDSRL